MKSPVLSLLEDLLADAKRFHPQAKGFAADISRCERRFEHEGLSFLTKTLPVLLDSFLEGINTGQFTCPRNFKTIPRGRIPRLFSGIFCEVFDPYSGQLIEGDNDDVISTITQITSFFKKAADSDRVESDLEAASVDQFFDTEGEVKDFDPRSRLGYAIERVSDYVLPHLSEMLDISSPKHGPGAVYEGLTTNQKWCVVSDLIQENEILPEYGFDTIGLSDRIPSEEYLSSIDPNQLELPLRNPHATRDRSRLVVVPKNSTSARTISVEPVGKQFVQQFLNTALREAISRCSILSRCLHLTDQSENQKFALEGSRTNAYSTLDLKSASDLLSKDIVVAIFNRVSPEFTSELMQSRASWCERDSRLVNLKKYAGMGNATTFPVQSITFAITAIASILNGLGKPITYRNVLRVSSTIRVFGDDIICKRSDSAWVVQGLEDVGLKVNKSKSYFCGNFRESCGMNAYKGVDITPVRLRFIPTILPRVPKALVSLISTSNQLWLKCWYKTAQNLQGIVDSFCKRKLPLVSQSSGALGWHTRQDAYQYRKYCERLHRWHIYAPTVRPVLVDDPIDGYPALYKSLLVPLLGRDRDHLERTPKRHLIKVSWKWVPPYPGRSA